MKPILCATILAGGLAFAVLPALAQDSATITQLGTNGVAAINQAGNLGTNQATILQNSGDANQATINQTALGVDPAAIPGTTTATITQDGNANAANIDQHDSNRSSAQVTQSGDRNQVSVVQEATDQGLVTSEQSGMDNFAVIRETGIVNDAGRFAAGVALQQTGNGNYASIVKHDIDALATFVTQTGDMNTVDMVQTGRNGVADALQVGNGNAVQANQASGGFVNLGIMQLGDNNIARANQSNLSGAILAVQQSGNGNVADVNEHDGSSLPAYVFQTGNANTATVDETGTNGNVFVSQLGDHNVANVIQDSTSLGAVSDLAIVTQNSNNNVANVSQVGAGFSTNISQGGGDGNVATVNQHF